MPDQNKKSPQVLVDLTGGWKIIANNSISQIQLIETLCDGDLARTRTPVGALRRFIEIGQLVGVNYD